VGDAEDLEHRAPAENGDEPEREVGVERDLEDVAVDCARPELVGEGAEEDVEHRGDGAGDGAPQGELG
jgi:hypothetical protein